MSLDILIPLPHDCLIFGLWHILMYFSPFPSWLESEWTRTYLWTKDTNPSVVSPGLYMFAHSFLYPSTSTGLSPSRKRSKSPKPTCLCLIQTDPMQLFLPTFPYSFLTYLRICETADPTSFSAKCSFSNLADFGLSRLPWNSLTSCRLKSGFLSYFRLCFRLSWGLSFYFKMYTPLEPERLYNHSQGQHILEGGEEEKQGVCVCVEG